VVKPISTLMKQQMTEWQWHQLGHVRIICTLLQTDNHASNSPLNFYRPDALPHSVRRTEDVLNSLND